MGSDDITVAPAETQLREDLADAMRESPKDSGKFNHNIYLKTNNNKLSVWKYFLI